MATEYYRLIQRRDTSANWTSANPILEAAEWGYETDTKKIKLGDGTTAWNDLAYYGGGSAVVAWDDIQNKPTFATVATTGSYNDLTDKPTVGGMADYNVKSKDDMAKVVALAKAGDYNYRLYVEVDASSIEIGTERLYAIFQTKYIEDLNGFIVIFISNIVDNELAFTADAYTISEEELAEETYEPEVSQFPLAFKDDIKNGVLTMKINGSEYTFSANNEDNVDLEFQTNYTQGDGITIDEGTRKIGVDTATIATVSYVDTQVGDINTILSTI